MLKSLWEEGIYSDFFEIIKSIQDFTFFPNWNENMIWNL